MAENRPHALKRNPGALDKLQRFVAGMSLIEARRVYIEAHMDRLAQTYRQIAKRHRMSAWYLSGGVSGKIPIARKHIYALSTDLSIPLDDCWFTPAELQRLRK